MQQARAILTESTVTNFEFLFDAERASWIPELGPEGLQDAVGREPWRPVRGFTRQQEGRSAEVALAIRDRSPEAGSFILYSQRRRRGQAS